MTAMRRRVTMADVARVAGVSRTTVSFVLNERRLGHISPDTQDRVREAAELLGYHSGHTSLAPRARGVGVVLADDGRSAFSRALVAGIREAAWRSGHLVVLGAPEPPLAAVAPGEDRSIDPLWRHGVVGVLVVSAHCTELTLSRDRDDVPTVLVNCVSSGARAAQVLPDFFGAAETATRHLVDHGHRRVGWIGPTSGPAGSRALAGYRQGLLRAGVRFDAGRVLDPDAGAGVADIVRLVETDRAPTAWCLGSNLAAPTVLAAADALDLVLPDDLSVVSADPTGLDEPLNLTAPVVCTDRLAQDAVECLLALADGDPARETLVECCLVRRDSVANIKPAR